MKPQIPEETQKLICEIADRYDEKFAEVWDEWVVDWRSWRDEVDRRYGHGEHGIETNS